MHMLSFYVELRQVLQICLLLLLYVAKLEMLSQISQQVYRYSGVSYVLNEVKCVKVRV
jgi:hypothetical protein